MAGWNDYWSDWSSRDALLLAPESTILEAIFAALAERSQFTVNVPETPGPFDSSYNAWSAVFDIIDALILNFNGLGFANQTYNGGVLNDADDIPLWTRETLASALSLDEFPTIEKLQSGSAQLAREVYQIINLITVLRRNAGQYSQQYSQRIGQADTWADAVAAFDADTWDAWINAVPPSGFGYVNHNFGHNSSYQDSFSPFYGIGRRAIRWLNDVINPAFTGVTDPDPDVSYTLSMYAKMGIIENPFITVIYSQPDYSSSEDNFGLVYSDPIPDQGVYGNVVTVGYFDYNAQPEPLVSRQSYSYVSSRLPSDPRNDDIFALFNFEVTGGFEFVSP